VSEAAVLLSPVRRFSELPLARRFGLVLKPAAAIARLFRSKPRNPTGRVDYARFRRPSDWNFCRAVAETKDMGLRSYLLWISQLYDTGEVSNLRSLHIPVLIIHGQNDSIVPVENGKEIASRIIGSRLVCLENANHMILTRFNEITIEITKFVVSVRSQGSQNSIH
jgi:pimeloyl-ACP methyl ester carboxylesterase